MAEKKKRAARGQNKQEFLEKARRCLVELFAEAEKNFLDGASPKVETSLRQAADILFASETQSFREGLLGCGLARLVDRSIDIRHPYFAQGHEMNFLEIGPWLTNTLGTIGAKCRGMFTTELLRLFRGQNVPATVKVRWNDLVKEIVGV